MAKLTGKVALVTGANKGIGKAIARGLASEGADVVLAARGKGELQEAADEIGSLGIAKTLQSAPWTKSCPVPDVAIPTRHSSSFHISKSGLTP